MTDRITHFIVVPTGHDADLIEACGMLRHVDHVAELSDGRLLVVLDKGIRDEEEGFYMIERTVKEFAGVKTVVKYVGGFCEPKFKSTASDKISQLIISLKPEVPRTDDDLEDYVHAFLAWRKLAESLHEASVAMFRR